MSWLRTLRRLVCRHKHLQRVTVDGLRCFRCACGYQVPQIQRTEPELKRARALLYAVPRRGSAPDVAAGPAPAAAAEGGEGPRGL